MNVFLLSHSRRLKTDETDSKIIGIYSSLTNVQKTIEEFKNIVGFKDYPNDFCIEEFEIITLDNKSIFSNNTVFFLQHEHSVGEYDYVTKIGMFFSYKDAKKYMDNLKENVSLQEQYDIVYSIGEFSIDRYIVDKNYWTEGFIECI